MAETSYLSSQTENKGVSFLVIARINNSQEENYFNCYVEHSSYVFGTKICVPFSQLSLPFLAMCKVDTVKI